MPQDSHIEVASEEAAGLGEISAISPTEDAELRSAATELARSLAWLPGVRSSEVAVARARELNRAVQVLGPFRRPLPEGKQIPDDFRWMHDNVRLVDMEMHNIAETLKPLRKVPHIHSENGGSPRALIIAERFLIATAYHFSEEAFTSYVSAFQESTVLNMKELVAVVSALKIVLIEEILRRASLILADPSGCYDMGVCISSLRDVTQAPWKEVLEPLVVFDSILRKDPAKAYALMDFESRELYRKKVVELAEFSDFSEV